MSKYIQRVRLGHIKRLALVTGGGRSLEQVKAAEQPDLICNAGFFEYIGKPTHHLKADGVVRAKESWGCWGYAWDSGGDIALTALPADERANYIGGYELLTPMVGIQDALSYGAELGSRRGRTAMALDGEHLILYVSGDGTADAATPEELRAELYALGAETAVMLDGGGSAQCDFGGGQVIDSTRPVDSYLCVWLDSDNEEDHMDKTYYTVTPSVGVNIRSGPGTSYGKVGAYAQGAVVAVLEERNGWGRTDMGWVSMEYLEPAEMAQRVTDNGITIQQNMIPAGRRNRPGGSNPDTYITIHETGNTSAGADAEDHGKYLASSAGEASLTSWHYTVDDHAIVQHIPDGETAYHAGDGAAGPGNAQSIGIEICVNSDGDFEKAKANAAALVRLLMAEHSIPLANIKQHHDWNGKNCPATIRATPGAWEEFLALCSEGSGQEEPEEPQQPAADTPADWAAEAWAWAQAMGLLDGTRPTANITRQEVAVFAWRLYQAVKAGK
ncbi:N-acetylmuramoyl-L-alanine amidase [Pseudoflavonifractor sp. CLA-AP-H29]|uniref:N-acetylmuramoyl-L-alanine amidase n=1 Tax=Pseudoflavonifractor intestinihominis TaxID=3133171 RepID=A0ABV1E5A5_9FIRM